MQCSKTIIKQCKHEIIETTGVCDYTYDGVTVILRNAPILYCKNCSARTFNGEIHEGSLKRNIASQLILHGQRLSPVDFELLINTITEIPRNYAGRTVLKEDLEIQFLSVTK